jgi:hypothetical protein
VNFEIITIISKNIIKNSAMADKITASSRPKGDKKPKKEAGVKSEPVVKKEKGITKDKVDKEIDAVKKKTGKNPWDTDDESDADSPDVDSGSDSDDEKVPVKTTKKRGRGTSDGATDELTQSKKVMKQCK